MRARHAESPVATPASNRKMIREGNHVKTILGTALILALGITGISILSEIHAQRMVVSSKQIFIHGTPVCVMQQSGEIIASVGVCGTSGGKTWEEDFGNGGGFRGEEPSSPLEPRLDLPPGHPPVGSTPSFEKGGRILI